MKQDQAFPSAGGAIILFLLFINAILMKDGYIAQKNQDWMLCLTLPLLVLAVSNNCRIKKPGHESSSNNTIGHDGCG